MSERAISMMSIRSRGTKPALYVCDILGQLEEVVFLLYITLPSIADRHGVFEWNPAKIRAQLSPYRYDLLPTEIERRLEVLASSGKLIKYDIEGKAYGYIRDYHLEQRPHHTEKPSGLKLPEGFTVCKALMRMTRNGSPCCHSDGTLINDADKDTDTDKDTDKDSHNGVTTKQQGQEGEKHKKGQEGEQQKKKAKDSLKNKNNWGIKIPLSDGSFYVPSQYDLEGYQEGFPTLDVPNELLKMVEYKTNNPEKRVSPGQQNRSIFATLKSQLKFQQGQFMPEGGE